MIVIYALRDPISNLIRYIGKTNKPSRRLSAHINTAENFKRNYHSSNWIRELLAQGMKPLLEIIHTVLDGENWQDAESNLIAKYRADGHPLTNMTAGGDGVCKLTSKSIKKMSDKAKMRWADDYEGMLKKMNGAARTAKISASMAARNADPEFRAKVDDQEVRSRQAITLTKTWAKRKAEIAGTCLERQLSERRSQKSKAAWADPDARKRRTEIQNDPNVNAKRSASLKATWARRKAEAANK